MVGALFLDHSDKWMRPAWCAALSTAIFLVQIDDALLGRNVFETTGTGKIGTMQLEKPLKLMQERVA